MINGYFLFKGLMLGKGLLLEGILYLKTVWILQLIETAHTLKLTATPNSRLAHKLSDKLIIGRN